MAIKNFVVDYIRRGTMYSHTNGAILWSLNQIQSPSLNMESDTVEATDAMGTPIMSFNRAKRCTLSGQNAIFDLGLLAAQAGTEIKSGNNTAVPAFEIFDVASATTITLSQTPVADSVAFIYVVNGDGTIAESYSKGSKAASEFSITGKTITLPTDVKGGRIAVPYEYAGNATSIVNTANEFPKAGKFVLEVIGRDTCDSTEEITAFVILPNAKLSPSTDLTFETEMTQAFELTASQDYCSANNELFEIIIPE